MVMDWGQPPSLERQTFRVKRTREEYFSGRAPRRGAGLAGLRRPARIAADVPRETHRRRRSRTGVAGRPRAVSKARYRGAARSRVEVVMTGFTWKLLR